MAEGRWFEGRWVVRRLAQIGLAVLLGSAITTPLATAQAAASDPQVPALHLAKSGGPAGARAQRAATGTLLSSTSVAVPVGHGVAGPAWVSTANGEWYCTVTGKTDFSNSRLSCTSFDPSTNSFGATATSPVLDWGYTNGSEQWVPTSNGTVDYCRQVGMGPDNVGSYLSCTSFDPSTNSFGATATSPVLDWGYTNGSEQWVPTSNGTVDYCRQVGMGPDNVGSYLSCTSFDPSTNSFGATATSPVLDWGYTNGSEQWVPTSNGTVDYCRQVGMGPDNVGSYLSCTSFDPSTNSFGATATSPVLDWGYTNGSEQWVPTSNGTVDYCRQVGMGPDNVGSYLSCTSFDPSTNSFGATATSPVLDWGYTNGSEQWVPTSNGTVDYCRQVGMGPDNVGSYLSCTSFDPSTNSFGATATSPVLDWGYTNGSEQWVPTSNGTVDYCRQVGMGPDNVGSYLSCTSFDPSTNSFGATATSPVLDWGFQMASLSGSSFAAPVTPPTSPNITDPYLAMINAARAGEGLGPLQLPVDYLSLSYGQQLITVINAERTSRGLPAFTENGWYDMMAEEAAIAGTDPVGPYGSGWASIWAMGYPSALGADYGWMYDDGYGGPNLDCTTPWSPGCNGHRRNILSPWPGQVGVGVDGSSVAMLFVES